MTRAASGCYICARDTSDSVANTSSVVCSKCKTEACSEAHLAKHCGDRDGCLPYNIVTSPVFGRHLVASRDIHPGELIFRDRPVVVSPNPEITPQCLECCATLDSLDIRCDFCKYPLCDDRCLAGSRHLSICRLMERAGAAVTSVDEPSSAYRPVAILSLLALRPKDTELISQLMDHSESAESEEHAEYWTRMLESVKSVSTGEAKHFSRKDIIRAIGLWDTNGHQIHDWQGGRCGYRGIFPVVSLLTHGCIRNTRLQFRRRAPHDVTCFATTLIGKGDPILTSYVVPSLKTSVRRRELKAGWMFECCCSRCSDPAELGAMSGAVKCRHCQGHILLNLDPLDWNSTFSPCTSCSLDAGDAEREVEELEAEWEKILGTPGSTIEQMVSFLDEKCRHRLHVNHALMTRIRSWLIPSICRRGSRQHVSQFDEATVNSKLNLCKENLAVLDIIDPGLSTDRGRTLFELQACMFHVAHNSYMSDVLSLNDLLSVLNKCILMLEEGARCFCDEEDGTVEAFFERALGFEIQRLTDFKRELE